MVVKSYLEDVVTRKPCMHIIKRNAASNKSEEGFPSKEAGKNLSKEPKSFKNSGSRNKFI